MLLRVAIDIVGFRFSDGIKARLIRDRDKGDARAGFSARRLRWCLQMASDDAFARL